MKNILFLLAFLFCNLIYTQETFEITFKKVYNIDDVETQKNYADKLSIIKNKPDYYILKVNKEGSNFLPTSDNASLLEFVAKDFRKGLIYKKYRDEKEITTSKWGKLLFKELKATKNILGYKCKTADIGSGIIAYYTEEIIIPGSPMDYSAMPGMVLAIDYGGYIATATSIKKTNEKLDFTPYLPK